VALPWYQFVSPPSLLRAFEGKEVAVNQIHSLYFGYVVPLDAPKDGEGFFLILRS